MDFLFIMHGFSLSAPVRAAKPLHRPSATSLLGGILSDNPSSQIIIYKKIALVLCEISALLIHLGCSAGRFNGICPTDDHYANQCCLVGT